MSEAQVVAALYAIACLSAVLAALLERHRARRRARRLHHDLHAHMVSEEYLHALECQGADPGLVKSIRQDNVRMRKARIDHGIRVVEFDLSPSVKRAMVPLGDYIARLP